MLGKCKYSTTELHILNCSESPTVFLQTSRVVLIHPIDAACGPSWRRSLSCCTLYLCPFSPSYAHEWRLCFPWCRRPQAHQGSSVLCWDMRFEVDPWIPEKPCLQIKSHSTVKWVKASTYEFFICLGKGLTLKPTLALNPGIPPISASLVVRLQEWVTILT